jgi:trigger factor
MTFEFDIEVRPEFELPNWKGLGVNRVVREFDDADIDRQIELILARFGTLVPHDDKAEVGDYLALNVSCRDGDEEIASAGEQLVRIRPVLSFRDGRLEKFDKLAQGAKAGDTLNAKIELTADAPNEAMRGKKVSIAMEVLEVKRLDLPELTEDFLEEIGDFASEDDFRKAVRADLERQLEYQQGQQIRGQITAALTAAADWELPPEMLKRQSTRELERVVLELRRSGFSEAEIRARENGLRQNSGEATAQALKEHFILERIAEEEEIEASSEDYDEEIKLISLQSGESPRRVRAQLDKRDMMDVLRNQIVERKVIQLIRDSAKFKDEPYKTEDSEVEAIDMAAGGGDRQADIPEAQPAPEEKPNPATPLAKEPH